LKFGASITYNPDTAKMDEFRPVHRAYLTDLMNAGKLAIAGPFTDNSGSFIVYEAETKEQAEEMLKADPFCKNGIFASWLIRPWKVVFNNKDLFD